MINDTVVSCKSCHSHASCPGGVTQPAATTGYYAVDDDVYVSCIPPNACLANSTCALGYEGPRCSECSTGYYRMQWNCLECSGSGDVWRLSLFIVVMVMMIGYLFTTSIRGRTVSVTLAAISIAYNFIQVWLHDDGCVV